MTTSTNNNIDKVILKKCNDTIKDFLFYILTNKHYIDFNYLMSGYAEYSERSIINKYKSVSNNVNNFDDYLNDITLKLYNLITNDNNSGFHKAKNLIKNFINDYKSPYDSYTSDNDSENNYLNIDLYDDYVKNEVLGLFNILKPIDVEPEYVNIHDIRDVLNKFYKFIIDYHLQSLNCNEEIKDEIKWKFKKKYIL